MNSTSQIEIKNELNNQNGGISHEKSKRNYELRWRCREVDEKKRQQIFEALQGITYLEWQKLSHAIEKSFHAEATKQTNRIEIAAPEKLNRFLELL